MEEILLWVGICIALGAAGSFTAIFTALRKRSRIMSQLDPYGTDNYQENDDETQGSFAGMSMVMTVVSVNGLVYCGLISMLILVAGGLTEVQETVAIGALLAMGLSVFFANIGRSLFYEEALEAINEKGEGDLKYSGRYLVFLVLPETTMIHGMLFAILGMIFSYIIGDGTAGFGMDAAESYLNAGIILGLSAASVILMGYVFKRTKEVYKHEEFFGRKMSYTVIPQAINIIGLVAAIVVMVSSGVMA